jgi:hypothetical protein
MGLVISKGLTLRRELPADAEADAYIAAVEAADGQALEPGVKFAIKNFVLCCKQDGIWSAIKASCILAGARTLTGALTPLVGTAPTSFNFVNGDYNRKTGLVGGNTKYLNSNRNGNAEPQNNQHVSVYASTAIANSAAVINSGNASSGSTAISYFGTSLEYRSRRFVSSNKVVKAVGFVGLSRSESSQFISRDSGSSSVRSSTSETPANENYTIFAWNNLGAYTASRLAFYSIGESLDLALLDARVTDLINAFGAAIP